MLALVKDVADETGALVLMVTHDPQDALGLGGLTSFVADGVAQHPVQSAVLLADPPPALAALAAVVSRRLSPLASPAE